MFIQEEHNIDSNNFMRNNSEKHGLCLKFYVTKMKYSKSLQRQEN